MKNSTVFLAHRRAVVGAGGVTTVDSSAVTRRRALSPIVRGVVVVDAVQKPATDVFGLAAAAPAQRMAPGVRPRGTPV